MASPNTDNLAVLIDADNAQPSVVANTEYFQILNVGWQGQIHEPFEQTFPHEVPRSSYRVG